MVKIAGYVKDGSLWRTIKLNTLSNLAHAMAKMQIKNPIFFQILSRRFMEFDPGKLPIKGIAQIYQFYLYATSEASGTLFQSDYIHRCREQLADRLEPGIQSALQRQVTSYLRQLFGKHSAYQILAEYPTAGTRLDIALVTRTPRNPAKVAAIQVDGPPHYIPGTGLINSQTLFNTRLLGYEGWPIVIRIPYFQIQIDGVLKQEKLESFLNTHLVERLEKKPEATPVSSPLRFPFGVDSNSPSPVVSPVKQTVSRPLPVKGKSRRIPSSLNTDAPVFVSRLGR